MRVTTAFNRVLQIQGASVVGIEFGPDGIAVDLRRRSRRYRCPCGASTRARYDSRVRRWRHVDLAGSRLWLRAEIARIWCRSCSAVRTEVVPWARPGARHSRDFEDLAAWLAQRMDKTSLARLLRASWTAIDQIVTRVVDGHLTDSRLDDLYRIGVDEISYRRGHTYLTIVADHDTGDVVWVGEGNTKASLAKFYTELGSERSEQLEAVTMDGSGAYIAATQEHAPNAEICFDAFHVIKWATEALDAVFRSSDIPALTAKIREARNTRPWMKARNALRGAKQSLTSKHRKILTMIRTERAELYDAWILKEELRDLYRIVPPDRAAAYVTRWIRRAWTSGNRTMIKLGDRIAAHYDGIVATAENQLSNGRLEGINTKIRVIQRRGYGHPNPQSLTAMIYLCCSSIKINLPTQA
ncbi:ISL3 family transposase [Microlunatus speluncae]|uniref:ISL3 family transposase n=1 Tax=Microlunatus speluncae TaxID=2594267 RepID=UPI001C2D4273|nr:ISL3 family transposase [Microlunatus speluncae]